MKLKGVDLTEYNYLLYYCKPFRVKIGDGKINTEEQIVFECSGDCGDAITTEQLPLGNYQIEIGLFNYDGESICNNQRDFALTSDFSCEEINLTVRSNTNELVISTPSPPNPIIKIFDPNWQLIYDCTGTCENEIVVPIESDGIYHSDIQFYDEHWKFICEEKQDIEVIRNSSPCDTSICAGNVILRTQAEVDSFCGCEVIEGSLNISGSESDITNLNNLIGIKKNRRLNFYYSKRP